MCLSLEGENKIACTSLCVVWTEAWAIKSNSEQWQNPERKWLCGVLEKCDLWVNSEKSSLYHVLVKAWVSQQVRMGRTDGSWGCLSCSLYGWMLENQSFYYWIPDHSPGPHKETNYEWAWVQVAYHLCGKGESQNKNWVLKSKWLYISCLIEFVVWALHLLIALKRTSTLI